MRAIIVEVSHAPAESLKPEKTSPPRVKAKLASIVLRSPISSAVVFPPARITAVAALRAGAEHRRVPIVPESKDRLVRVAPIVVALGHE